MLNFSVCENKYNFCHHLILTASMTNQEWKILLFLKSVTQKKNLITNITYIKTTTVFVIKVTNPPPPITKLV